MVYILVGCMLAIAIPTIRIKAQSRKELDDAINRMREIAEKRIQQKTLSRTESGELLIKEEPHPEPAKPENNRGTYRLEHIVKVMPKEGMVKRISSDMNIRLVPISSLVDVADTVNSADGEFDDEEDTK